MTPGTFRLRVRYEKGDRLAFLGHIEVINTINRCVRRARLPFRVGNGFARRMSVQFCQALPVGASSSCEFYDLALTEQLDEQVALEMLAASTPSTLAPRRAAYVTEPQDALEAWLTRARWEVELVGSPCTPDDLLEGTARLASQGSLTYARGEKQKVVDLTSTLVGISQVVSTGSGCSFVLDTRACPSGSLRPAVLVDAEGLAYDSLRVRRVGQWHEGVDGSLVEPM